MNYFPTQVKTHPFSFHLEFPLQRAYPTTDCRGYYKRLLSQCCYRFSLGFLRNDSISPSSFGIRVTHSLSVTLRRRASVSASRSGGPTYNTIPAEERRPAATLL